MQQRDQWGSRLGFILAAAGSAIGLGNIWRYPYVVYANGGGAFLIPYFFALITAGIPILLLEFGIGRFARGSAPLSLRRLSRRFEWLGWWQVLICFVITTYYVAIVAWSVSYFFYAFDLSWGENTEAFLYGSHLGLPEQALTEQGWQFGGMQWKVLLPMLAVWAGIYYVLYLGVQRGIERMSKWFIPLLLVMMIAFVIRAVTLPGAVGGLNHLFTPDFAKILPPLLGGNNPEWHSVWLAAYGQIFFSLSIAFAIMITYSSYMDRGQEVNNSGIIMAFSNSGFEYLAAIGVFAAIGFMAQATGVSVEEAARAGVGLAFVVFPQIINAFPAFNGLFGALFFLSLVIAGFSSLISIMEVIVAAFMDKFNMKRTTAVTRVVGVCALVSLLYATGSGVIILDIVDHFINSFGIVLSGLVEVLLFGWFFRLSVLREENNAVSDYSIGRWWDWMIKGVTPLVLLYMSFRNFELEFIQAYEGYPAHALITFGWTVVVLTLAAAIGIASRWGWPKQEVLRR
ncbi:sodium-dependent transporter [Xylanibacillus composti]|uniref:Transporter n=1 Tax=Xylanibacillus composti TaxID=1572762 RepID=A0A8J4GZU5_9BACL|nr:sodium-dependent transporter [Xylanibacillus composti]MDT9724993.1 sodium-dependent transporter [Xylanibacillus composti]GIQ68234.1 transporter [Xylanibacillus composti]